MATNKAGKPQKKPSCRQLDLGLLLARIVRKYFLFLSHPICGTWLRPPKQTNTVPNNCVLYGGKNPISRWWLLGSLKSVDITVGSRHYKGCQGPSIRSPPAWLMTSGKSANLFEHQIPLLWNEDNDTWLDTMYLLKKSSNMYRAYKDEWHCPVLEILVMM